MISIQNVSSKLLATFFVLMTLFAWMPGLTSAQPAGDTEGGGTVTNDPEGNSPPGGDPEGGASTGGLMNPLKANCILDLILAIIDILLIFALPIVILYIMYGGYLLVTAQGEAGKIETGRTAILWAIVGGVVIFGAHLIIDIIQNTVISLGTADSLGIVKQCQ